MNYTIQSGDTLGAIAQRVLGSASRWREIASANGIAEGRERFIQPGQVIQLPDAPGAAPQQAAGVMQPTTGVMPPRPRPDRPGDTAPLPRDNPQRMVPLPRPRPEPMASGPFRSGSMQVQQPAPMMGMPQGLVPGGGSGMQNPAVPVPGSYEASGQPGPSRVSTNPDAYAGRQGALYAAYPPERAPVNPGSGGMPDLSTVPMEQLSALFGRAQTEQQRAALYAEVDRRRQMAEVAYQQAGGANSRFPPEVQAQNRRIGTDMRIAPPAPPVNRSIGEGDYLPDEQRLLMQVNSNMNNAPQANTMSPQLGFLGGFTRGRRLGNLTGPGV